MVNPAEENDSAVLILSIYLADLIKYLQSNRYKLNNADGETEFVQCSSSQ